MEHRIIDPDPNKLEKVVRLCKAHAEFEECDYNFDGKVERLKRDLFGDDVKLHCKVVEIDSDYVGYITWMEQYSTWDATSYLYMDCLYIDNKYRSLGLGEMLVDKMKDYGRGKGIDLVQWQTPDFNVRAIKFYKRIGAYGKSKERFFLEIK